MRPLIAAVMALAVALHPSSPGGHCTVWIDEAGFLEGPVFITNTHSVGVVRDAYIKWAVQKQRLFQPWALPVVAETYDGHQSQLRIAGVPIGAELAADRARDLDDAQPASKSIIIVIATDARLLPHQLSRPDRSGHDALEQADQRPVRRDGAGHRGGHRQRADRRRNHDRFQGRNG